MDVEPCYYCGLPADTVDHTVPKTILDRQYLAADLSRIVRLTVPACRECNSLAGPKVFLTLAERRAYVKERLRSRLGRYLAIPEWTEGQLGTLGPNLRSFVAAGLAAKRVARGRLSW